jgi:hypothetical protein
MPHFIPVVSVDSEHLGQHCLIDRCYHHDTRDFFGFPISVCMLSSNKYKSLGESSSNHFIQHSFPLHVILNCTSTTQQNLRSNYTIALSESENFPRHRIPIARTVGCQVQPMVSKSLAAVVKSRNPSFVQFLYRFSFGYVLAVEFY